nr:hypothetical protein [uncultured Flavobacterium sp.]
MKKYLILLITFSLVCSRKSANPTNSIRTASESRSEEDSTTYFSATGNEPSWQL